MKGDSASGVQAMPGVLWAARSRSYPSAAAFRYAEFTLLLESCIVTRKFDMSNNDTLFCHSLSLITPVGYLGNKWSMPHILFLHILSRIIFINKLILFFFNSFDVTSKLFKTSYHFMSNHFYLEKKWFDNGLCDRGDSEISGLTSLPLRLLTPSPVSSSRHP